MTEFGIDVGYAERRPTLGFAVRTTGPGRLGDVFPKRGPSLEPLDTSDGYVVEAVTLTIAEFLHRMDGIHEGYPDLETVVIDGMLAPGGPPRRARDVDTRFMSGLFQNRAVPASVVGGGQQLVDATYRVTEALLERYEPSASQRRRRYRFSPRRDPNLPGVQIFETNPTVGMAVLLEPFEVDVIPSRGKGGEAKSDFYFKNGAGKLMSTTLGTDVSEIKNHELRAALYALAVAAQVSGGSPGGSSPGCFGDVDSGIYVLTGPVHSAWRQDLERVGVVP